jgi:hypothetical protein
MRTTSSPGHLSAWHRGTAQTSTAILTALSLMVGGLLTTAMAASAAQPARASVGQPATTSGSAGATSAGQRLLLITGVRLTTAQADGLPVIGPQPARPREVMTVQRVDGQTLEIPADAIPYLSRGLDPRLFDLQALAAAESDGRLPVRVTFTGREPEIPGLIVTLRERDSALGFFSAGSAWEFGAALAGQYAADHRDDRFGADGLFAHSARIWLAGSLPFQAPPRGHHFQMATLTVRATDLRGKPDTGDSIEILGLNSSYLQPIQEIQGFTFDHGVFKVSVPDGPYYAIALFGNKDTFRTVVLPQFLVRGTRATIHVAEKSASSEVRFAVPRRSTIGIASLTIARYSTALNFTFGMIWSAGVTAWVNPTSRKPSVGRFYSTTQAILDSPPKVHPGYQYQLDFPAPRGTIEQQRFRIGTGDLGTVAERFYAGLRSSGVMFLNGENLSQRYSGVAFGFGEGLTWPQSMTIYFTAGYGVMWQVTACPLFSPPIFGIDCVTDDWRQYRSGQRLTENWDNYPLHPAADTSLGGQTKVFLVQPSALRAGNTLMLSVTPFSDNQFGHLGPSIYDNSHSVTERYAVDENGGQIARGSAADGIPAIRISGRPARIRFTLTAHIHATGFDLSPDSETTWTWRSARDTSARVPDGWYCRFKRSKGGFAAVRRCAVQSMMTLSYIVRGMSLRGRTKPGPQVVDLTVRHIQLARPSAITGVTAQVSFNSGRDWRAVAVTQVAKHRFRLSFTAPAGVQVSTKVSATDAAGGSITETIHRGYAVAGRAAKFALLSARVSRIQLASRAVLASHAVRALPPSRDSGVPASQPFLEPACGGLMMGALSCDVLINIQPPPAHGTRPVGWGARAIERAYRLPVSKTTNQTVAVSAAYTTPGLASYLATYRHKYGLPPCTQASGCLRIVNEYGKAAPLPPSGVASGWDLEAVLDVAMISAACPHCKILVVEANNADLPDLAKTDEQAARLGAQVILNSYGVLESGPAMTYRKAYDQPGHMVVAASGDDGFDIAQFPADLSTVTAVGGTELAHARNERGFTETAWSAPNQFATGSGCSAFVTRPPWQHLNDCPGRTVADVAAVAADVPVYDKSWGGWITVWGTSVAAALIAGIYGLAANAVSVSPRHLYLHAADFFDVTTGNNAVYGTPKVLCDDSYMCQAKPGYDAPTGLGTPNGIGGF